MADKPIIGSDLISAISRELYKDVLKDVGRPGLFWALDADARKKRANQPPPLPVYGPERPSGRYGNDCWTISVEFNNEYGENIQETTIRINSGGYEAETAEFSRDEARRLARDLLAWVGDE